VLLLLLPQLLLLLGEEEGKGKGEGEGEGGWCDKKEGVSVCNFAPSRLCAVEEEEECGGEDRRDESRSEY